MIDSAGGVGVFEVDDLDADTLLRVVGAARLEQRRADRLQLRLAVQWARLHATGYGPAATWEGTDLRLAGPGTPWLAAGAPEEYAGAMGVRTLTAQALLADALDLVHRLPLIRARVEDLAVDLWKARKVAVLTRPLPREAAGWVDAQLAGRLHRVGLPTIHDVVDAAKAVWCPELLDKSERTGRAGWHVSLTHGSRDGWAGTSWLEAVGGTDDLLDFHHLVTRVAEALAVVAGDPDPVEVRKAKAIGLIGRGEHHPLLTTLDQQQPPASPAVLVDPVAVAIRPRTGVQRRLFVHLTGDQLAAAVEGEPGTATVAGFGTLTTEALQGWLGHDRFTVTPVVDLARTTAVDAHDPPSWMRTVVVLRDRHCIFPYCQVDGWATDLDHIVAYRSNGPPGQTTPDNLACCCRRHHNAKTHHGWRYTRLPDGSYQWTSPRGVRYRVHPTEGTERLD